MSRFYLSSWVRGAQDIFRPAGAGREYAAIDLHPPGNPDQREGSRCLLWLPEPTSAPGLVDLGDDLDARLPRQASRLLENRLGLTLDQPDRLRTVIAELLILHGRHDRSRWNPLRPNRRGFNRIVMGGAGVIFEAPAILGAVINEDWNVADNTSLTNDLTWTEVSGTTDFNIRTNRAQDNGVSDWVYARAEHDLASDDHYAQADVSFEHTNSSIAGLAVRFSASASTFYLGGGHAASNEIQIWKNEAGTLAELAATAKAIAAETLATRFEVDGSALDLDVGGTTLAHTDTAISGNVRIGIAGFAAANETQNHGWDNFEAGDLATGVTGTVAATQAAQTGSASGQLGYSGSMAAAQADQTPTASGTVTGPITGSGSPVQADQTSSATGQLGYTGTISVTQDDQTSTASGTVAAAGVTGTASPTQDDQTATATGALVYTGTIAAVQDDQFTISAALAIIAQTLAQLHRFDSTRLHTALIGRGGRVGFHSGEGWERVSDTFVFDGKTGDADQESMMNAVSSAWAAHAASDAGTLKTSIHAALDAAGFRRPGGTRLI